VAAGLHQDLRRTCSGSVEEITDEAPLFHLYQHGLRIDGGRAGPAESQFRHATEAGSCPDDRTVDRLQSDFERLYRIGARQ